MNRIHLISLLLITALWPVSRVQAQFDYGNDWYISNPGRTYIKLVVAEEGIYRVTRDELLAAGYDLSQVDARWLRMYFRGKEIPIFVNRNGAVLEYVEFYARPNDGRIDSLMYRNPVSGVHEPDLQPNKEISLFTSEAAYFLTWGNTQSGSRFFSVFDNTYQLMQPEAYFRYESREDFLPGTPQSEYVRGGGNSFDAFYTLNSDYITGEGYVGPDFSYGANGARTVSLPTPFPANAGNPVLLQTRVYGRSYTPHILRIEVNGNTTTPAVDSVISVNSIYVKTFGRTFNAGTLTATTDITYRALRAPTDNNHVCWSSITYDRLPNLGGNAGLMIQDWAKTQKAYFRLENLNGNDTIFVYDLKNRIRHKGVITLSGGNKIGQVIVLGFAGERDLYVSTDAGIKKPQIKPAALNGLYESPTGADYVIIAHRSLAASAQAYAQYRDTATVNDVTARIVYTDEIYDEFGYGSITPWAIKRFCKYALDNWAVKPKYFLLWGKGVYTTRGVGTTPIVPTYGYPATDYEFVSHFDFNSYDLNPEAAIGRVNIYTDAEGLDYLAKVIEYEQSPWQSWMKEGVFLGGGANVPEQNSIESAFQYAFDVYEDEPFGGRTSYFQKRSSSVIDPGTAFYHDKISSGVGLIHFFGHSTSNILDISIREPNQYNNFGKYPLMIAMGCYGGDFTVGGASFGELWVKQAGRGSIGYIANSSAGYLLPLRDYSQVFYDFLYQRLLGEPVGVALQQCLNLYTDSLAGIQYRNHGRQLNLQGDPAVRLYTPKKADLAISQSSIYFSPANFTAQDDSFTLNLIVRNLGLVSADSFIVRVRQQLPNGDIFEHPLATFPMIRFEDTVGMVLKNPVGNASTGQNYFDIFVDPANEIEEYSEANNQVLISRIIPGNIPAILYPSEFAVIEDAQVTLQASAFFMTRDENVGYIFEIDTTEMFNSPLLTSSGPVTGKASQVSWTVPITLQDSGVYYWRVRLRDVTPATWSQASFRYIPSRTGWAQADFPQFKNNTLDELILDNVQEEWRFDQYGTLYEVQTYRNGGFAYSINGSLETDVFLYADYQANGVAFVSIDQYTLRPTISTQAFGRLNVAASPFELYKLRDAILNTPEGDYFIVGSHKNPQVQLWPEAIFEALEEIGASDNIRYLQDGDAFLILGRKGYPNSATEILAPNFGGKYFISSLLRSYYDKGQMEAPRIGPSIGWKDLIWSWNSKDPVVQERAEVSVYGINQAGEDTLLFSRLRAGTHSLADIDAATYPYLRLEADVQDSIRRTAPQLDNWHVLYTPAPDAVLDPTINYAFRRDTVAEGQDIFISLAARNISASDMDSVLVRYVVERPDRSLIVIDSMRIAPLLAGGPAVPFEFTFNTLDKGLSGRCLLIVELNPGVEQPEQYTFNNLYVQPFHVLVDKANPLLDVTFDGKRIINGDVVSPAPEILIEVNDENTYIPLDDSTAFELYFKRGTNAATDFERIFISTDPRLDWRPASLPENKARLYFYPGLTEPLADGDYTLRVQGRDRRGNEAGQGENFYEIRFKVENKSTITHVLNYPNPFSSSTRFVYTLTGSQTPDVFQIHIYTISGKQVKVIDLKALGDVHVGRNITTYAWDGTDEYGDKLANGVYLYRVVIKTGEAPAPELRDNGTSQYFNNGWGKMYILR
ncbi:MAG: C25 family cysteine peptidase [Bacteroidia bacterium]|nr:C25 family cysteine peptidase [Bacteroidia bacterium]